MQNTEHMTPKDNIKAFLIERYGKDVLTMDQGTKDALIEYAHIAGLIPAEGQ